MSGASCPFPWRLRLHGLLETILTLVQSHLESLNTRLVAVHECHATFVKCRLSIAHRLVHATLHALAIGAAVELGQVRDRSSSCKSQQNTE